MEASPYALGFTTLQQEVDKETLMPRGAVPKWLNGALIRTGPAKFELGRQSYNHWFDGLGMLYKFHFNAGQIVYSNRYLRGVSYCESMRENRIRRDGFGTTRSRNLLEKLAFLSKPKSGDNCNVNVVRVADDLVALTETPTPLRFDGDTLETIGGYRYQGDVAGQVSTAHPHYDFQRHCLYNYVLEFGPISKYHLYSVSAKTKRRRKVATIPVKHPAYMHSFAMTERYLVLSEFPYVTNSLRFLLRSKPFIENYRWEPGRGTLFHVIDKDTGKLVKTAASDACFAFHHVNAFEQDLGSGPELAIDVAAYPDASVVDELYLSRLRTQGETVAAPQLMRFRLPMNGGKDAQSTTLADTPLELPRIDYRNHSARPYRFVYAAGRQPGGAFIDSLVKIDIETGATDVWHDGDCYPGEPVFVRAPDAKTEQDGVVLSVVLDATREVSFLIILDANTFTELGHADLPHHLPFGFHGNFFSGR